MTDPVCIAEVGPNDDPQNAALLTATKVGSPLIRLLTSSIWACGSRMRARRHWLHLQLNGARSAIAADAIVSCWLVWSS